MEGCFWEGPGWHVLGLGKLTEVRLSDETGTATYLMLFLKEDIGKDYSERVASFLAELLGWVDEDTPFQVSRVHRMDLDRHSLENVKSALEQFFTKLNYRTILDQSDLQTMRFAKGILPDFYQRAMAADVEKIIMY